VLRCNSLIIHLVFLRAGPNINFGRRYSVKHLLLILTLFTVALTTVAVNADETEDREAIRAIFHQDQEGHRLGNEEMVRSAHWDDFYIIRWPRINDIPRYMLSDILSGEEYFGGKEYEPMKTGDDRGFTGEINHIAVKGDVALAVTQFHSWGPDKGGVSNAGHQAMWVAERRNGIWKWKSVIVGFEGFREWTPASEPAQEVE
jgi:hypothetical protein